MDVRVVGIGLVAAGVGGGIAAGVRALWFSGNRLDGRLRALQGRGAAADGQDAARRLAKRALPKLATPLMPGDEAERSRLRARMIHAGLYASNSLGVFLGVKLVVMFTPPVLGMIAGMTGLVGWIPGLLGGIYAGGLGLILPSMWLDSRKKSRQVTFRRSLPDALDLLVICVEGGLTLGAALTRIADALRGVHPTLAAELDIARREMQLGCSAGEALRSLAQRTDLEEVRGLASVLIQSERLGAGLAKSLRIHAETLRQRRQQKAEELAQKASTKVLIPTLFCIFPAVFVVILGPAAIQLSRTLGANP